MVPNRIAEVYFQDEEDFCNDCYMLALKRKDVASLFRGWARFLETTDDDTQAREQRVTQLIFNLFTETCEATDND